MSTRTIQVKQKAHAFTFASICGLVLSVPACLGLAGGNPSVRDVAIATISVQGLLVVAAVYFWLFELPAEVRRGAD